MFQMWRGGTQVQGVSPLGKGKEDASSRGGGTCGHATKGAVKEMEKESSMCLITKGAGAL